MSIYVRKQKYIVHIDGDNFFASCELARFPHLRTKPVVVGRERGIAVAYNSHAKALGITRAMPIHQIQKQFPQVTILASHFELYKTFSKRIILIAKKYMDSVSVYSIDEVFCEYFTDSDVVAEMKILQQEVFEKLGITVSIGIAETKTLAKLATSVQKPNGVTLINKLNRNNILKNTPIGEVWGIGKASRDKWLRRGIVTALDFINLSKEELAREYLPARNLYNELSGIPMGEVIHEDKAQQSFQSTESFPKTNERSFLFSEISRHIEILGMRILEAGLYTKSISVYLKDHDLRYYTEDIKLKTHSADTSLILNELEKAFDQIYDANLLYKSTGVTFGNMSDLVDIRCQSGLFDDLEEAKQTRLISPLETLKGSVRAKFGHSSLYSGSSAVSMTRKLNKRIELSKADPYIYGLPLPYLGEVQ
jgi:DNA polymerase-4/DNA polymerase V